MTDAPHEDPVSTTSDRLYTPEELEAYARQQALESFDGDSSTLSDIHASLSECVQLRQEASQSQRSFAWRLIFAVALALLGLLGWWGYQKWHDARLWENFLTRLRAQPGIVITETGERDGKWLVGGLRDPLAVDPLGQHVEKRTLEHSCSLVRVVEGPGEHVT